MLFSRRFSPVVLRQKQLAFLLSSTDSRNSPVTNSDNLKSDCMSKLDKLLKSADASTDDVLSLIKVSPLLLPYQ